MASEPAAARATARPSILIHQRSRRWAGRACPRNDRSGRAPTATTPSGMSWTTAAPAPIVAQAPTLRPGPRSTRRPAGRPRRQRRRRQQRIQGRRGRRDRGRRRGRPGVRVHDQPIAQRGAGIPDRACHQHHTDPERHGRGYDAVRADRVDHLRSRRRQRSISMRQSSVVPPRRRRADPTRPR